MCRREFQIAVSQGDFRKDFKIALDICSPMDDISSDKSGVMNGAAGTSDGFSEERSIGRATQHGEAGP
jgi:hypothetical protein